MPSPERPSSPVVIGMVATAGTFPHLHGRPRTPPLIRGKATLLPQAVTLTVFVKTGSSLNSSAPLRIPILITPGDGRDAIRTFAVGLPTPEMASLMTDAALVPGMYRVTSDLAAPTRSWKFKIHAHDPLPSALCPHDVSTPSEYHSRYVHTPQGGVFCAHQIGRVQSCCRSAMKWTIHPHYLLLYQPLQGPLRVTVEGKTWTVRRGQYLIVNPSQRHEWPEDQAWPVKCRAVNVWQPAIRLLRDALGLQKSLGPIDFAPGPHPISPAVQTALAMWDHVTTTASGFGVYEHAVVSCKFLLLQLLLHHPNGLIASWHETAGPSTMDPRLQAAINYMHTHYEKPFTIGSLTTVTSAGGRWLRKAFWKHFHQSPKTYLQSVRMRKAMDLLSNRRLTIDEVAHEVGYTDVRSFRRVFRTHAGSPPGAMRASQHN